MKKHHIYVHTVCVLEDVCVLGCFKMLMLHNEFIFAFVTKVRGQTETCFLEVTCPEGMSADLHPVHLCPLHHSRTDERESEHSVKQTHPQLLGV